MKKERRNFSHTRTYEMIAPVNNYFVAILMGAFTVRKIVYRLHLKET